MRHTRARSDSTRLRSLVYEPLASCVQDCIVFVISVCTNFLSKVQKGSYLPKESTTENPMTPIEPVDDRICVFLHRCGEDN